MPLTTPRFEAVSSCKNEVVRRRSAVSVSAAKLQNAVSDRLNVLMPRTRQDRVCHNNFVRASFFIAKNSTYTVFCEVSGLLAYSHEHNTYLPNLLTGETICM